MGWLTGIGRRRRVGWILCLVAVPVVIGILAAVLTDGSASVDPVVDQRELDCIFELVEIGMTRVIHGSVADGMTPREGVARCPGAYRLTGAALGSTEPDLVVGLDHQFRVAVQVRSEHDFEKGIWGNGGGEWLLTDDGVYIRLPEDSPHWPGRVLWMKQHPHERTMAGDAGDVRVIMVPHPKWDDIVWEWRSKMAEQYDQACARVKRKALATEGDHASE
jgi:hypothetical protein